jgi:hypothetical protein
MKRMTLGFMILAAVACGESVRVQAGPGAGRSHVERISGGDTAARPIEPEAVKAAPDGSRAIYQAAMSNLVDAVGFKMDRPAPMMEPEQRLKMAAAINLAADKIRKGK